MLSDSRHNRIANALRDHPICCFMGLFILVVAVCVGWYFCVRYGFFRLGQAHLPEENHRLGVLANVGSAFQILSTVFSALAFAGVLFTLYLQRAQLQADLNQNHLHSLQDRLGELIGPAESDLRRIPADTLEGFERAIKGIRATRDQEEGDERKEPFLEDLSLPLKGVIPIQDQLRRQYIFKALHSLISNAPPSQRKLFKESVLAQIHHEGACWLILQAIAAKDREFIEIFGSLGAGFSAIEADLPHLREELERRFGNREAKL